jgi:hypothetical protein
MCWRKDWRVSVETSIGQVWNVHAMFMASMPAMWRFDSLLARVWLGGSSIGDLAKTETVSVLF